MPSRRSFLAAGAMAANTAMRLLAQEGAGGRWTRLASLPVPRFLGPAVVAFNRKLYVAGGMTRRGDVYSPSNKVHEYDPVGDQWTERASMPTARSDLVVVCAGRAIYAIGGNEANGSGRGSRRVERYDPAANKWSAVAEMPTARCHMAAVSHHGAILAIGGRQGNVAVEEYDVAEDRWRRRGNLPSAKATPFGAVAADRIVVIGGTRNGKEDYSLVHRYDAAADAWVARISDASCA